MPAEWIGRTTPADEPPDDIHVTHMTFGRPDIPFADLDRVGCLMGLGIFVLAWAVIVGICWLIWGWAFS